MPKGKDTAVAHRMSKDQLGEESLCVPNREINTRHCGGGEGQRALRATRISPSLPSRG